MTLTPPPVVPGFTGNAPNRNNPGPFSEDMDTYLGEMQPNVDGENALATWMNDEAVPEVQSLATAAQDSANDSESSAVDSSNSASEALVSENNAESSAVSSANSAASASIDFTAASSTSFLIGIGSKTFSIETGKGFVIGQILKAASAADPVNEMSGEVTSASSGSVTILVTQFGGSGTHSDWSISLAAAVFNDQSTNSAEGWTSQKIQTELNLKANKDNAALTGIPTAPTAVLGTKTNQLATTEFVSNATENSPSGITLISTTNITTAVAFVDIAIPSQGNYLLEFSQMVTNSNNSMEFTCLVGGSEVVSQSYQYASVSQVGGTTGGNFDNSDDHMQWQTSLNFSGANMQGSFSLSVSDMVHMVGNASSESPAQVCAANMRANINNVNGIRIKLSGSGTYASGTITLRKYA